MNKQRLMNCWDCGNAMSSRLNRCPHCESNYPLGIQCHFCGKPTNYRTSYKHIFDQRLNYRSVYDKGYYSEHHKYVCLCQTCSSWILQVKKESKELISNKYFKLICTYCLHEKSLSQDEILQKMYSNKCKRCGERAEIQQVCHEQKRCWACQEIIITNSEFVPGVGYFHNPCFQIVFPASINEPLKIKELREENQEIYEYNSQLDTKRQNEKKEAILKLENKINSALQRASELEASSHHHQISDWPGEAVLGLLSVFEFILMLLLMPTFISIFIMGGLIIFIANLALFFAASKTRDKYEEIRNSNKKRSWDYRRQSWDALKEKEQAESDLRLLKARIKDNSYRSNIFEKPYLELAHLSERYELTCNGYYRMMQERIWLPEELT